MKFVKVKRDGWHDLLRFSPIEVPGYNTATITNCLETGARLVLDPSCFVARTWPLAEHADLLAVLGRVISAVGAVMAVLSVLWVRPEDRIVSAAVAAGFVVAGAAVWWLGARLVRCRDQLQVRKAADGHLVVWGDAATMIDPNSRQGKIWARAIAAARVADATTFTRGETWKVTGNLRKVYGRLAFAAQLNEGNRNAARLLDGVSKPAPTAEVLQEWQEAEQLVDLMVVQAKAIAAGHQPPEELTAGGPAEWAPADGPLPEQPIAEPKDLR